MKYCTKCVLPDTHETIAFDGEGVCNICRQAEVKHEKVDWDERKRILDDIAARYGGRGQYDCIVPFSGGKDSTFQLWYIVKKLGLKPLAVRFDHWGYRPLVRENNDRTFKKLGVDILQFTPNWRVVRLLMLESLKRTGDFCWFCHTGVFAHTMQIAIKYGIPLVIWGESSSEYRAYRSADELEELNNKLFNEMINLSITADDMYEYLDGKVDKRDLAPYVFPPDGELEKLGAKSIWLGNYIQWNTKDNVDVIKKELGWQGQQVEGIPPEYDYEKIECKYQGVRDWCKYIKRGHGRTNHLACIDIRNGEMDRETGLALAEKYDGKRPASLDYFLEIAGISEDEFVDILTANEVKHWGFDRNAVKAGRPLPDMAQW
jgi:N-acetyl sugar amidotransferase